jgi:hypothetical protein
VTSCGWGGEGVTSFEQYFDENSVTVDAESYFKNHRETV